MNTVGPGATFDDLVANATAVANANIAVANAGYLPFIDNQPLYPTTDRCNGACVTGWEGGVQTHVRNLRRGRDTRPRRQHAPLTLSSNSAPRSPLTRP